MPGSVCGPYNGAGHALFLKFLCDTDQGHTLMGKGATSVSPMYVKPMVSKIPVEKSAYDKTGNIEHYSTIGLEQVLNPTVSL